VTYCNKTTKGSLLFKRALLEVPPWSFAGAIINYENLTSGSTAVHRLTLHEIVNRLLTASSGVSRKFEWAEGSFSGRWWLFVFGVRSL